MRTRRTTLTLFTLTAIGLWGFCFSRLAARHNSRGLLDLEPRITATGQAVFDDEWFGLYLDRSKVGWHHYVLEEGNPQVGEKYRAQSESRLVFSIFGTSYPLVLQTSVSMDSNLDPLRFKTVLVSPLQRVTVQGKRGRQGLSVYLRSGKMSREVDIPLPADGGPLVLQETLRARLVSDGIAPGKEFTYTLFDPVLQLLAPLRLRIRERETVTAAGATAEAYPVDIEFQGIRMRWWTAEDGTTVRGESFLGGQRFREEKEPPDEAVAGLGDTKVDLIAKTRIEPRGAIPPDGFVSRLQVRLQGFNPDAYSSLGGTVIRRTTSEVELLLEAGVQPLGRPLNEEEKARYLGSTLSVTADDERVVDLARRLTGEVPESGPGAEEALEAARAAYDWVRRNVRKEFVIGYPAAGDVIETRRGDCNEHASLLAALCRAAGVPCKAVAGVVHLNGSFYYHAWNEVYIEETGRAGWLPVDAAFGQWPADATHIRFVEGDPAEQAAIMALFGSLRISVLPTGGTS